jgi:septal ring factor EnvC (AmiA/AmiB activator)
MDTAEKQKLEEQSKAIRAELKEWERQFAASHDGNKASREDIKQNPHIGMSLCPPQTYHN